MSQLRKAIEKLQRGETTPLGFGLVTREKPRALLLGALVRDAEAGRAAAEAGVDAVIVHVNEPGDARDIVRALGETVPIRGAWLGELDAAAAASLKDTGCDFVASPLDGTRAEAVDTDAMGQVLAVTSDMEEATLRALGPLGLDALFLKLPAGEMTLALQVDLARLAMLSGAPLLVNSPADVSATQLRVLRDAGAAAVIAPENTPAKELKALGERLREVPAKSRTRSSSRDIALVPRASQTMPHEHDDDDDDE